MDAYKIAAKVFVRAGSIPADQIIALFQRWIRDQSIAGHRLIDVADYAHVVAGPGTVLVASEGNFHIDHAENRLGLMYFRKLPLEGRIQERLQICVREALGAAGKLQSEPELEGKLVFGGEEIQIRLNDRLLAPATEETVEGVKPAVEALGNRLYGATNFSMTPKLAAHAPAEFSVKASREISVASALEKLGE